MATHLVLLIPYTVYGKLCVTVGWLPPQNQVVYYYLFFILQSIGSGIFQRLLTI